MILFTANAVVSTYGATNPTQRLKGGAPCNVNGNNCGELPGGYGYCSGTPGVCVCNYGRYGYNCLKTSKFTCCNVGSPSHHQISGTSEGPGPGSWPLDPLEAIY